MRRPSSFRILMAFVSCCGLVMPQSVLEAGVPASKAKAPAQENAPAVVDVALAVDGTIPGQLISNQGKVLKGEIVSFWQGNRKVASTLADENGRFVVKGLSGGLYRIVTKDGQALLRIWPNKTAPPSARTKLRLVSGKQLVRGQSVVGPYAPDLITLATVGLAVTAVTLSAVSLSKVNSLENKVDDIDMSPN